MATSLIILICGAGDLQRLRPVIDAVTCKKPAIGFLVRHVSDLHRLSVQKIRSPGE